LIEVSTKFSMKIVNCKFSVSFLYVGLNDGHATMNYYKDSLNFVIICTKLFLLEYLILYQNI
jgi:hypothetical protein